MGSKTEQTTTQSAEPPAWARPHLENIAGQAKQLYDQGGGFDYFPGSTVTPFSSQTLAGLRGMEQYARGPAGQLLGGSQNFLGGILGGGGGDPMSSAAMGAYGDLAKGGGPLDALAAGKFGDNAYTDQLNAYARGDYINGGSPQFLKALDYQSGQIGNQVNQISSGMGRYGSAAHAGAVADKVGAFRDNALQQEMARQQGQQLQAAGLLGQQDAQRTAQQLQALGLSGQQRLAGASGILGSQFQAAGMAPGAFSAGMLPFQSLANIGGAYEGKSDQYLQDAIARFQQGQQSPFQRLAAYQGAISGLNPAAYATRQGTSTSQQPWNPLSLLPLGLMMF